MQSEETVCAQKACRHLKEHCVPRIFLKNSSVLFLKLCVMSNIVLALDMRQKTKYYEKLMHETNYKDIKEEGFCSLGRIWRLQRRDEPTLDLEEQINHKEGSKKE